MAGKYHIDTDDAFIAFKTLYDQLEAHKDISTITYVIGATNFDDALTTLFGKRSDVEIILKVLLERFKNA